MLLEMEHNRIRKLLSSEYCDFADRVLIESPFAETTRDGRGLRQVALGLTPSRLVIAADILKNNTEFTCPPDLDPTIESFELVSVYPLEFVAISVFCRRKRRTLKARLIDGRAKYYELGGMQCRNVFWALWCESVRDIMAKKQDGSSLSETTAASSSSASTLYLVSSGVEIKDDEKNSRAPIGHRVWARYMGAGDGQSTSWCRKDLYLGPAYDELSHGYYTPVPVRFAGASLAELTHELRDATPKGLTCKKTCSSWPCARKPGKNELKGAGALCDVLFTRERKRRGNRMGQRFHRVNPRDASADNSPGSRRGATASETSGISPCARRKRGSVSKIQQRRKSNSPKKQSTSIVPKLSRFGFGVGENCGSGLYLDIIPSGYKGDRDQRLLRTRSLRPRVDPRELIDDGVRAWENAGDPKWRERKAARHPRRYALATAAHFFHALGPWSVQPGERESVQRTRASSAVCVRRQPLEAELRLPVSKRQLAASVSMTSLEPARTGTLSSSTRTRVVLFWTPEYWYRPRAATAAYRELRRHLSLLRDFRDDQERGSRKTFFCRRRRSQGDERTESVNLPNVERSILGRIFSSRDTRKKRRRQEAKEKARDGGTCQLRRLLRMDLRITAWDLDSATIARQLTLIDRELFQRIPRVELEVLVSQRSSRNAPNIGAWIAFSHRISCLAASEILATKKIDMRTRILARFINAADKCFQIGNFHSCRSILAGLQSPSVYRLESTWSRLRTRHSIRYEAMERLCRLFQSTITRDYQKAWKRCEGRPPMLPYVGDLLARILHDHEEGTSIRKNFKWTSQPCRLAPTESSCSRRQTQTRSVLENACKKIVSSSLAGKKNNPDRVDGGKKEQLESERLVDHRKSIGRRLVAAAMTKIGCSRPESSSTTKKSEEVLWSLREHRLAQKFYSLWRRRLVTSKFLAINEAKIREMEPKKRRIMRISNWLCECQRHSRSYDYPGHSLAWEFLLKARYREEKENFFISLKLEPPCG